LPQDLIYLALVESYYDPHAYSRAAAVGMWQFMTRTARAVGLRVDWWVDERRDPVRATEGAVRHLLSLHDEFGSPFLAAAAYNGGSGRVSRGLAQFAARLEEAEGEEKFFALSDARALRPETRDYVPKIIAAALIAKNRTQFGFPASTLHPGDGEAVSGDGEVVKLEKESEAERQPTPGATSTDASDTIASVLKADELDDYEDAPDERTVDLAAGTNGAGTTEPLPLARPVPTPHVTKKGEVGGEELAEFEVQSPADLLKVARAAGLSYHTVKALNPELLRWCTPPTVNSYRIKLPASAKEKFLATYNHDSYPRKVQFLTYKVRRGDTLARIAGHFGIKVDPITDLNGVSPRVPLRSGVRVLLPMPNDRSRTLASLEVRDPPERRRYRRSRPKSSSKTFKVSFKKRGAARARPPKT
jgi:membrane-bound lytic murein transglycosylase D